MQRQKQDCFTSRQTHINKSNKRLSPSPANLSNAFQQQQHYTGIDRRNSQMINTKSPIRPNTQAAPPKDSKKQQQTSGLHQGRGSLKTINSSSNGVSAFQMHHNLISRNGDLRQHLSTKNILSQNKGFNGAFGTLNSNTSGSNNHQSRNTNLKNSLSLNYELGTERVENKKSHRPAQGNLQYEGNILSQLQKNLLKKSQQKQQNSQQQSNQSNKSRPARISPDQQQFQTNRPSSGAAGPIGFYPNQEAMKQPNSTSNASQPKYYFDFYQHRQQIPNPNGFGMIQKENSQMKAYTPMGNDYPIKSRKSDEALPQANEQYIPQVLSPKFVSSPQYMAETQKQLQTMKSDCSFESSNDDESFMVVQNIPVSKIQLQNNRYTSQRDSKAPLNKMKQPQNQRVETEGSRSPVGGAGKKKILEQNIDYRRRSAGANNSNGGSQPRLKNTQNFNTNNLIQQLTDHVPQEAQMKKIQSSKDFEYTQKALTNLSSDTIPHPPEIKQEKAKKNITKAYWEAAERGNVQGLGVLLNKQQVDPNVKNSDNWTTLHLAASEGYLKIAEVLLQWENVSIDPKTVNGRTPLHIASLRGTLNIARLLIEKGADVNNQDNDGNTPIHLASLHGHVDLLEYLLSKNVTINIKNKQGQMPLQMNTSKEIMQVFEKYFSEAQQKLTKIKNPKVQNFLKQLRIVDKENKNPNMQPQQMMGNEMGDKKEKNKSSAFQLQTRPQFLQYGATKCKQVKIQDSHIEDENYTMTASPKRKEDGHKKKPEKQQRHEQIQPQQRTNAYDETTDASQMTNQSKIDYLFEISTQNGSLESQTSEEENIGPHSFLPIQLLGKGSFGEVYLVKKHDTKKLYAMKILQKDKIMGQNLTKYAKTERNVLSYTAHPFIVGLHFAFQTSEKLFLILDYCPGGDMGHVLQRERKFSEERARMYLAEIILALEDLHQRDIIFRDLKPDNVVLDPEGHALLTDFGLSKEGVLDNSAAKSFCGSVAYLAPEMLKRCGHGKSVDWYLLGVLFYEMLIGMPPYFSADKDQLFHNIERGVLRIPATLSDGAKGLLISLLNRNPNRRLGAGPGGAEDIKNHQFFDGINWNEVYARRLAVPKPFIKQIEPQKISGAIFKDKGPQHPDNNIPGWSFINGKQSNQ